MRDIKFRVFREGEMIYDDSDIAINRTTKMLAYKHTRNTLPFMQYTGLTDSNGVEIYEGDILDSNYEEYPDSRNPYCVVFHDGAFRMKYNDWPPNLLMPVLDLCNIRLLNDTIIGNIHENPELLTENKT